MDDDRYESVLLVIRECTAYRIPPRNSAKGYKAADWDVNSFLWKGRLRIIAKGDDCFINLEDGTTGELFAACPYPPDGSTVEPVLDSSRYFVLTLVDKASGRKAFIGMGFPERSYAFDFNVALQDHVKRVKNAGKPVVPNASASAPAIDFSLKDDQKFSIRIGGLGAKKKDPASSSKSGSSEFGFLPPPPSSPPSQSALIPPPPTPAHTHAHHSSEQHYDPFSVLAQPALSLPTTTSPNTTLANASNDDWASFGDFQSGTAVDAGTASGEKNPNEWATFE
ncbi:hypothetical protein HK100_001513 [Physocladia obscura]|uniref:NECAP PHear domain-containing protein n=1 Tax=Physocladia obscura TaxID=109957 RepID=A0AAD5XGC2_9FUNG|nr:hypothetical protein HK100_001513 [Physocladia obscura]